MKKLLPGLLGLVLFSAQPASAVSVLGEEFAATASELVSSGGILQTGDTFSSDPEDIALAATDENAATSVLGRSADAFLDLAFSAPVIDVQGDDLGFFVVGAHDHNLTVQLFSGSVGSAVSALSFVPGADSYTEYVVSTNPDEGIFYFTADLGALGAPGPVDRIRLGLGDGATADSAVVSLVGASAVVPVPAAVWMFGTGLIALVGIARRRCA
ncbi:MAG: VPLPA-CTERM sorting domain-containing protein [Gammaproteobacteria bacterium]|jgi:hypothetical protein